MTDEALFSKESGLTKASSGFWIMPFASICSIVWFSSFKPSEGISDSFISSFVIFFIDCAFAIMFPCWSKALAFFTSVFTRALNKLLAASTVVNLIFALLKFLFTPARIPAFSAFGLFGSFLTVIFLPTSSTFPLEIILPLTSIFPCWSPFFKVTLMS